MNKSLIAQWHELVESQEPERLETLIDERCVFYSPVVFRGQEGKRLTVMYLTAAFNMFKEAESFEYVKEIEGDHQAVLEFVSTVDGIVINGIDLISWNDEGLITEFKVMVRPLQGIEKIKEKMLAHLSTMSTFQKLKLTGGIIWDKIKR